MSGKETPSLDELVARYLERLDQGETLDPSQFIASWPELRQRFLDTVSQIEHLRNEQEGRSQPRESETKIASGNLRHNLPRTIAGYELQRQIGRGGMSRVFAARRLSDETLVAVKVLSRGIVEDSLVEQRFQREAEAIQCLDHPHIVPLLECGTEEDTSFLVLKLIDGSTLAEWVEQRCHAAGDTTERGALERETGLSSANTGSGYSRSEFRKLAEFIAMAAEALQAAHDQGITHRDVKPSNLMLDHSEHLWLTDFGLASLGEGGTVVTHTGQLVGTPNYMSPEQACGDLGTVDHRTDIYSLGATLYELVTLKRPHSGDRFRVLMEITSGRLTPPSKVCPQIPRSLEAIILKAMAYAPGNRYQSASDFAKDLKRFVAGQSTVARVPGVADRVMKWATANPRKSLFAASGVSVLVFAFMLTMYLNALSLSRLNQRLGDANVRLLLANQELDANRDRLQRYLYVADVAAAYRAYAQRDMDAVQQLLSRHVPQRTPSGDTTVDYRGYEWWLLQQLSETASNTLVGRHEAAATSVALTPDKKHCLSVGHDGTVRRWVLEQYQPLNPIEIGDKLDALAIAPDGKRFLTGQNVASGLNPVFVRSMSTGEVLQELQGHEYAVESAAFSQDGQWLATAGRYHEILLHDADGELRNRRMTGSRNESLAFAPDEKKLFAIERGNSKVRQQRLVKLEIPSLEVVSQIKCPFSPNVFAIAERSLAVATVDAWALLDRSEGSILFAQSDVRGRIRCLDIDHLGQQLAIGCDNGLIYFWDLKDADPSRLAGPRVVNAGPSGVADIAFSEGGRVISALGDGSIREWDFHSAKDSTQLGDATFEIANAERQPNILYRRCSDGRVVQLDLGKLTEREIADLPSSGPACLASTADGKRIAVASGNEIIVFNTEAECELARMRPNEPQGPCIDLAFVEQDLSVVALYDAHIVRFRVSDGKLIDELPLAGDGSEELLLAPDKETVIVVTRKELLWLSTADLQLTDKMALRSGECMVGRYSNNGDAVAVGYSDGTIELLSSPGGQRLAVLQGHRARVCDLVFLSNDSTLVSTAEDGAIRFWDLESARELAVLSAHEPDEFFFLHMDPIRRRLITFSDRDSVRLWPAQPQD